MPAAKQINRHGAGAELSLELAAPWAAAADALQHAPSSDTAAVVTVTADPDRPIVLTQIICSYTATPTAGSVKIEDGSGNVVFGPLPLAGAGPHVIDLHPPRRSAAKNTALIGTLSAGGTGISGVLILNAHVQE